MTLAALLAGPVLDAAVGLLGAYLTTTLPDGVVTVRLTEVEAYAGEEDPGSHAFRGRTERNAVMFGPPGRLYVYRHLGLHHCANVVTGPVGSSRAVLLRAGEVVAGSDVARARRLALSRRTRPATPPDVDLARGPARLTVALGIDLALAGADVVDAGGPVHLELGPDACGGSTHEPARVATGPRVGVSGEGGRADLFPWRLWLADDPTVSAYRAASRRRSAR